MWLYGIKKLNHPLQLNAANIGRKVHEWLETYGTLVKIFQILYPEYKYEVAPIIIGAMGYVLKSLINIQKWLGLMKENKILWPENSK